MRFRAARERTRGIPCLVLAHGKDWINIASLKSIIECDPRLRIDVVHNPSASGRGEFLEYARSCLDAGSIDSLCEFDANISNNALLLWLLRNLERYRRSEYLVISDNDVLVPPGTLDEQIGILSRHPNIFACGLRVDASKWPDTLQVKRGIVERYNTDQYETADYVRSVTGLWMLTLRSVDFVPIVEVIARNGMRFTDGNVKRLGHVLRQKMWVATKHSMGNELNREQEDYQGAKSESSSHFGQYSPEPPGSGYAVWNHDYVAQALIREKGRSARAEFPSLMPAAPRHRGDLESDPVCIALATGKLILETGVLVKSMPAAAVPGLYLMVTSERPVTGIPNLGNGIALIFVAEKGESGPKVATLHSLGIGRVLAQRSSEIAIAILTTVARFVREGGVVTGKVIEESRVLRALTSDSSEDRSRALDVIGLIQDAVPVGTENASDGLASAFTDRSIRDYAAAVGGAVSFMTSANPDQLLLDFELTLGDTRAAL